MNLKTISLNVAAATAIGAVATLSTVPAPALAASITASGSLFAAGSTTISPINPSTSSNLLVSFQNFSILGAFGSLAGTTGTPTIANLPLTYEGGGGGSQFSPFYNNPAIAGFISGLSLPDNTPLTFNLFAGFGDFIAVDPVGPNGSPGYAITGPLKGELVSGNTVIANGTLSALNSPGISNFTLQVTPVPTPALLPGLVALGAGVLRKRKAKAEAMVEAED